MSKQPNIWVLGDPHLHGDSHWQWETAIKIIEWIEQHPFNNKDTHAIVLGDIVHQFKALPPTHTLVLRFLQAFKCPKVFLLVGNHDIDKMPGTGVQKERSQYVAYDYVVSLDPKKFVLMEYPQLFEIGALRALALPYYVAPTHCIGDYSSKEQFQEKWPRVLEQQLKRVDFVIAHAADVSSGLPPGACINVRALVDAPLIILGHIHTANMSEGSVQYTGSLYPLKIDEKGERYQWFYDAENAKWLSYPVPVFCDLLTARYGDPLPKSQHKEALPVYTIYNCASEERARQMYGPDVLIRKLVTSWEHLKKSADIDLNTSAIVPFLTKEELLQQFEEDVLKGSEWAEVDNIPLTLQALSVIKEHTRIIEKQEASPSATN